MLRCQAPENANTNKNTMFYAITDQFSSIQLHACVSATSVADTAYPAARRFRRGCGMVSFLSLRACCAFPGTDTAQHGCYQRA
eukprot:2637732-Rhodomonas_salina.2